MESISTTNKIVIYSHDTMGLGHVRRNLLIATALAKSHLKAKVLLISGTHQLSEFDLPAGVDCLTLPGITKSTNGSYAARQYKLPLKNIIFLRASIIKAAVEAFEPDVFIADNVPRGVEYELDPILEFLSTRPNVVTIFGMRDILDAPEVIRKEWGKKQNEDIIQRFYDVVWVYGDQNFFDTSKEYGFSEQLKKKLSFTGYLDPLCRHKVELKPHKKQKNIKNKKLPDSFHLCLAGGGQDGVELTQAFAHAIIESEHHGVILTGPFLPDKSYKKLKKIVKKFKNIKLIRFHHEPVNLIKKADKVVSMGGYNSVSEILAFKKTALIIPRVEPRQEQWIRACKLSDWSLIDFITPETLNSAAIKHWLDTEHNKPTNSEMLDFNGLDRIIENIDGYLNYSRKKKRELYPGLFFLNETNFEPIPMIR